MPVCVCVFLLTLLCKVIIRFWIFKSFGGLHSGGKLLPSVDSVRAGKRHDALKLDSLLSVKSLNYIKTKLLQRGTSEPLQPVRSHTRTHLLMIYLLSQFPHQLPYLAKPLHSLFFLKNALLSILTGLLAFIQCIWQEWLLCFSLINQRPLLKNCIHL